MSGSSTNFLVQALGTREFTECVSNWSVRFRNEQCLECVRDLQASPEIRPYIEKQNMRVLIPPECVPVRLEILGRALLSLLFNNIRTVVFYCWYLNAILVTKSDLGILLDLNYRDCIVYYNIMFGEECISFTMMLCVFYFYVFDHIFLYRKICPKLSSGNFIDKKCHVADTQRGRFFLFSLVFSSVRKNYRKAVNKICHNVDFHGIDFSFSVITSKIIVLETRNFYKLLKIATHMLEKNLKNIQPISS